MISAMTIAALLALSVLQPPSTDSLDLQLFRTRIQPIFLKKKEGHARCIVCHTRATTPFRLQPLRAKGATWTDEETRLNFEAAAKLVAPGKPLESRLLRMPLVEEAGGTAFHPGGKHWESTDDPDFQALFEWVRGH
jgi:hypothetical protein